MADREILNLHFDLHSKKTAFSCIEFEAQDFASEVSNWNTLLKSEVKREAKLLILVAL